MTDLSRLFIFLVFITIITALGYSYVGFRMIQGLKLAAFTRVILWALIVFFILMGPLAQILRIFYEESPLSDIVAWIAYISFGFFALTLFFVVVRDLGLLVYEIFMKVGSLVGGLKAVDADRKELLLQMMNLAIVSFTGGLTFYGFFQARKRLKIETVEVPIKDLPREFEGFTIAQITDLHVGPTIKQGFVEHVVKLTNSINPDIIAVTGDLVDGSVARLRQHVAPLKDLKSKHGTFFVTGNHEYYSGVAQWIGEAKRLGMQVLLNEHKTINRKGKELVIAGVTDFHGGDFLESHRTDPHQSLINAPKKAIKILLAHQPKSVFEAVKAGFHLQLSGHTHGGQFFPGNLFVPLQQPFVKGLHKLDELFVYVSCGTGYWGPPLRLGTRSEISQIKLVRA